MAEKKWVSPIFTYSVSSSLYFAVLTVSSLAFSSEPSLRCREHEQEPDRLSFFGDHPPFCVSAPFMGAVRSPSASSLDFRSFRLFAILLGPARVPLFFCRSLDLSVREARGCSEAEESGGLVVEFGPCGGRTITAEAGVVGGECAPSALRGVEGVGQALHVHGRARALCSVAFARGRDLSRVCVRFHALFHDMRLLHDR